VQRHPVLLLGAGCARHPPAARRGTPPAAKLPRRHRRRRHWPDRGFVHHRRLPRRAGGRRGHRRRPTVGRLSSSALGACPPCLRACWSVPILSSESKVSGTFALYYREPRRPRPQDLEVLAQIAAVAAVAIQHQRAHERLRHEEQELRQIVDAIPQTIVVLGPDGRTLYANQAMLAYTGLTLDEVMAADFRARVFHPDDVARLRDARQQALARGLPFALEQRARRHDGQYRWFLTWFNPLRDDQGRLVRWYVTGTDIDE